MIMLKLPKKYSKLLLVIDAIAFGLSILSLFAILSELTASRLALASQIGEELSLNAKADPYTVVKTALVTNDNAKIWTFSPILMLIAVSILKFVLLGIPTLFSKSDAGGIGSVLPIKGFDEK